VTIIQVIDHQDAARRDPEFLCSPPIEGRASLSRGADATAWFLAAEMRKIGLLPASNVDPAASGSYRG
jgi:hypothetical protein